MHVVLSLDVGGLERNVVNQVREGRRLGQEVSILCVERRGALAGRAEALGARVLCVDKPAGFRPGISFAIRRALKQIRPDVIHTHQIGPLFYCGFAAMGLGIPLIVHTEHGKEDYSNRKLRVLGKIAGRFAKVFYCLTQDMADAVEDSGVIPAHKLRVIMNGIDTAFYRQPRDTAAIRRSLNIPADAPLIGTVGRLTEIKRQDVLIAACARVIQSHPRVHVLLVGEGPLREALSAHAASQGIADRVHFAGYQSDTTAHLHAMDIFALTSRSEGMPQALLEACVAEKPVVASRVGGIPEVIQDGVTGRLVPPGDVEALAAALSELLCDRDRADKMAQTACSRVVSIFDISRMASDYHWDFRELLANGSITPRRQPVAAAH
jgi:glycosyltransferase involved in cell wall biosynthesis